MSKLNIQCSFLGLVLLMISFQFLMAMNYCKPNLCRGKGPHIACKNSGTLGPKCPDDAVFLTLTADQISKFLDNHNLKRSQTATGSLPKYAPAKNMSVVTWDKELAHLAGLNAKTCVFAHDKCRATDAFPYSGQNIAIRMAKPNFPDATLNIKQTVNEWFNEYKFCNMKYIKKYSNPSNGKMIGHFTAIVADRTVKIGCAMVKYTDASGWKTILTVCNYSFTNMLGQPVYKKGPACTGCVRGCSTTYPGLCNP